MIKRLMSVSTLVLLGFTVVQAASSPIDNDVYRVEQATTCQGKVVDANGEPLIGASVAVKGNKTQGSITDVNGAFTIKGVQKGATLHVSYIGYKGKDVKWDGSALKVTLEEDANTLDEAVVVGYGTMKRSDLSGASVTMSEEKIKGSIISSLDQSFQGRVAGVTAVQTSGAPGSSSSINVRGIATINANKEPLYVIDGVIVQSGGQSGASFGLGDALGNGQVSTISPISTIDPADIVSMEILKDASATAIYGAQGANGVILITTKRGKANSTKFSYNGSFGVNRQTKRLDMMDLREFAEYYQSFVDEGHPANAYYADPSVLGKGTNWQDAVFQTALQHNHQVSAQGGTDNVKYYVSGSYMNQDGTIIGSAFERYSFRSNLDADLTNWLKFTMNAAYSNSFDNLKLADSNEGILNYSLTTVPSIPIYNVDGSYSSVSQEGYTNPNPIAKALMEDILLTRQKLNGSFAFDVTPIEHLTWHAELGYDLNWSKGETWQPTIHLGTWDRDSNTSAWSHNNSKYYAVKNYLTYANTFGKHSMSGMFGQELWDSSWENARVEGSKLPSDEVHNPALGAATPKIGVGFGSSSMASFFTRWTYNWNQIVGATYTYRYDGSSNFGPKNRWAGFHAFAANFRFSQLGALKESSWLSNGKLRAGWGQTGNSGIGGYKWGAAMSVMPSALGQGYRPANIANTSIKWETQEQINLGLDLGFMHDIITVTLDLYNKESRDMLMPLQLPSYMGTSGNGSSALAAPWGNFGHIRNRGVELTIDAHPFRGNFQWDINFNISANRNKLVSLNSGAGSVPLVGYGQWTDVVSRTEEGMSLYEFYGYVTDGVYTQKDFDEIAAGKQAKPEKWPENGVFDRNTTVWVGDIKYKDINGRDADGNLTGKPDGRIDEDDQTSIGSPLPKFTFGLTNTFRWKNFDLSLFITGSYGNKVLNYNAMGTGGLRGLSNMSSLWTNQLTSVKDRTILAPIDPDKVYEHLDGEGNVVGGIDRGDGKMIYHWYDDVNNVKIVGGDGKTPRATISNPNNNVRMSDRYIEDGSYIRLKNISLGYTFPSHLLKKMRLEELRIYANIQNLFTLTKYSGYDPEVGASTTSQNVFGCDNGRYPSPTTYQIGLQISFGGGKLKSSGSVPAYNPQVVERIVEKEVIKEVPVEKIVEKVVEKEVKTGENVQSTYVVNFAVDSSKIENTSELDGIKKGQTVEVIAYASPEGRADYNEALSQRRADAVAEYLKARGVNVVRTLAKGANTNYSNRIAIVTIK